jgi:hypothetical protein
MSNKRHKIVANTQVGTPRSLSEIHVVVTTFHGFEDLSHEVGESTCSPEMLCHGHTWRTIVCPGSSKTDNENEPYISIFLRHKGGSAVKLTSTIRIGSIKKKGNNLTMMGEESQGKSKLLLRRGVLELDPAKGFLVNGALTVEVDIQVYTDAPPIYIPPKRLRLNMEESLASANEGGTCVAVGA